MVRVTLTAKGQMKGLAIDDQLLKADEKVILEDLIVVAHEDARKKAERLLEEKMKEFDRRPFAAARYEAAILMVLSLRVPARWQKSRGSRDRAAHSIAGAPAGAWAALGAPCRLASDSQARGASGAVGKRAQCSLRKNRDMPASAAISIAAILARSAATNAATRQTLIVVETVSDLWALERAGVLSARYHVLGGLLSPLDGIGPKDLNLASLAGRVAQDHVKEVIVALNATVDGQTTAHYITSLLADFKVKITRLAHGVPVGGELDYLDEGTLTAAIRSRTAL